MARHDALLSLPLLSLWRERANAFLAALTLLASSVALGQAIPQFSTVEPHQYDTINLATLGIQLNVPVRSKAGHIPFSLSLTGTSQVVYYTRGGFLALPTLFAQESHLAQKMGWTTTTNCTNPPGVRYSGFYFTDSSGNTHPFTVQVGYADGLSTCGPSTDSGYATDSSGLYMTANANGGNPTETVWDINGNVVSPGAFTDPSGNSIICCYTDTLGQVAVTMTGSNGSSDTATWTDALGNNQSIALTDTKYTLETAFGCSYDDPDPSTQSFPTSVSFPDTSTMSFTWEKTYLNNGDYTGRLASITLPTGGLISYAYSGGTNGINCYDGTPATMTRTTPDGKWTYTHTSGSGVNPVTTVKDPLGNNTVYTFTSSQPNYQIEKQVYNGTAIPANLIETVITCYNNTSSTPANCNSVYVAQVAEKDEYTTYPGVTGYSAVKTAYNGFGLVTDVKMFDFNATTATNEKQIVYGSGSPTQTCAAISARIIAKPCVITLYDSQNSNAILSQTWNSYDSNGNLLQTWNRVSGSGGTGTYLTKSYTYTKGVVQTMTDVNGEVMNYTTTSCNNMFVTSQHPSGFTNLTTSQVWDCNGGVVTSSTDPNGQITSTNYYVGTSADPFYRPLQEIDETGNITSFTYTSTPKNTADSTFLFNGNSSVIETLSTTDSIGRPTISQLRQGPSPNPNWDTKSRTFDADGRVYETSLPCVKGASLPCSASTESQTYDALNRPLVHTGTGGDVVTKQYIGQDVVTTLTPAPSGENPKKTQKEYDGLGRLKSVCVISGATGSGPCGQTNGGTGFLTTYSYDGAGRLLQTVENAQVSSPQQKRTYVYDLLGRLTLETNPESGTTTYPYDSYPGMANSPGDQMATIKQNGDGQYFYYDGLHRLQTVAWGGPDAYFCKRFRYDNTTGVNGSIPPGITVNNPLGRLAEAETDNCLPGANFATITDEWFSYDQRGEMSTYYQKSPNSNGYYALNGTYWADKSLNTVSGVSLPTITYGGLDGEGRVQAVSASTGTNPVTGVTYDNSGTTEPLGSLLTVALGTGDTQNFTYYLNTGRMHTYSASVGSTPTVISGTLNWSPNGTLLSNTISDGYNSADTQVCTYLYDDFIRVAGTTTPGVSCVNGSTKVWNQTFTYGSDAFGNLTKTSTGPGLSWACAACYNTANNQYNSTLSASITYDANGNLTNDTFHSYTWDVFGHVSTIATPPNGSTTSSVVYDANGNKVEENVSGTIHEYVSAFGVTAQMTGQTENSTIVPLPGGVQALYSGGTLQRFRFPDWQGSIRAESNPSTRAFTESLAFAPFGERYALKGAPFNVDSFTGKPDQLVPDEYDFPAREEHNGQGRWVSPDPMRGTGNKYVYADNNPLSNVDLYGLWTTVGTVNAGFQAWLNAEEAQADPLLESRGPTSVLTGAGVFGVSENAYLTRVNSAFEGNVSVETPPVLQYKEAQAAQIEGQQVLEAQNRMLAQIETEPGGVPDSLRNEKTDEIEPNAEVERALEPIEPAASAAMLPGQSVLSQHSASDIEAVRNGACPVDPAEEEAIRVNDTFNNIKSGGPFPYKQDGTVFENREGLLPAQPFGYYKEFTVEPLSGSARGAMRLVTGAGGEFYYTDSHYQSFVQIAGPTGP